MMEFQVRTITLQKTICSHSQRAKRHPMSSCMAQRTRDKDDGIPTKYILQKTICSHSPRAKRHPMSSCMAQRTSRCIACLPNKRESFKMTRT